MIENIKENSLLTGLSRIKNRSIEVKVIHSADEKLYYDQGWQLYKKLKSSIQIKRDKSHSVSLEDRV